MSGPADWCMWFDVLHYDPGNSPAEAVHASGHFRSLVAAKEEREWRGFCAGPSLALMGTPEAGRAARAQSELAGARRGPEAARARGALLAAKAALRRSLAAAYPPVGRPSWEGDDWEWEAMAEAAGAAP